MMLFFEKQFKDRDLKKICHWIRISNVWPTLKRQTSENKVLCYRMFYFLT